MPRIRGHYEFDDESLRPGSSKEGGLHQNLYDEDGHLRASARFIPDEGPDPHPNKISPHKDDPDPVYIYVYTDDEQQTRSKEQQEFDEAVARFLLMVVAIGIKKASPHVRQFWDEKARPAIAATWERRPRRREPDRSREPDTRTPAVEPVVVKAMPIAESSDELAVASRQYRANMSSAEAQARYLIALAAKAFSDEQMTLLANADIDDGEHLSALERGLAQLPPQQVAEIIGTLEVDPAAFTQGSVDADTVRAVTRMERARTALRKRG